MPVAPRQEQTGARRERIGTRPLREPAVSAPEADGKRVIIGEVVGVHGVKGWIKVHSCTRPRENIFHYRPWALAFAAGQRGFYHYEGRRQGKGLIAKLDGIGDRTAAAELIGAEISIGSEQLPALPAGEYYWHDLLHLQVVNLAGRSLGRVAAVEETGANDVLLVRREGEGEGESESEGKYKKNSKCFIPWVPDVYIRKVDLAAGSIVVDWEADEEAGA